MFRDLGIQFEPKEYFVLFRKSNREPKYKLLSRPSSGGGVVVKNPLKTPNPCRIRDDDVEEEEDDLKASGTLTMFCCKDGHHYALTCYHVARLNDAARFEGVFKVPILRDIPSNETNTEPAEHNEYYYNERDNPEHHIHLGSFHKRSFDSDTDIMSIQIPDDVEVDCNVAEVDSPNWTVLRRKLLERVTPDLNNLVQVAKVGHSTNRMPGYIVKCSHTYKCPDGHLLYKDAIVIKDNETPFLQPGDSGALLWFYDEENRKQPLGYCVGEVDELYPDQTNSIEGSNKSGDSGDEETRESVEETRESDEETRESVEETRESDEETRESVEETRESDEETRESVEETHESDEETRESDEETRESDEETRESDEETRGSVEENRESVEETRESVEETRESVEETRESDSDDFDCIFLAETGPYYICLKLDTALRNLELLNAGCFRICSGSNQAMQICKAAHRLLNAELYIK